MIKEIESVLEQYNCPVSVRGSVAYFKLLKIDYSNILDFDICLDSEDDFDGLYKHLVKHYNEDVRLGDFMVHNNIPRKRIIVKKSDVIFVIDVLLQNGYYLNHEVDAERRMLRIPSLDDYLGESLLAISSTSIGIDYQRFPEKNIKLLERIANLKNQANCENVLKTIENQLQFQNIYYHTEYNIYDILHGIYLKLKSMQDYLCDEYLNTVSCFLVDLCSEVIGANNDEIINFSRARDKYGCFSNFSLYNVFYKELKWVTSEHCYQAQKFLSKQMQFEVFKQKTPKMAADVGRSRPQLIRADWYFVRLTKMYEIVFCKVNQNAEVLVHLLGTKNKLIIETSEKDSY